jgi:hypothetical protein
MNFNSDMFFGTHVKTWIALKHEIERRGFTVEMFVDDLEREILLPTTYHAYEPEPQGFDEWNW